MYNIKSTDYCANKQAVEVAVIDSGDCEAWHRARGIKLTLYKEMVTLFSMDISNGMICLDYCRCVRDTKRAAGMLVRFSNISLL